MGKSVSAALLVAILGLAATACTQRESLPTELMNGTMSDPEHRQMMNHPEMIQEVMNHPEMIQEVMDRMMADRQMMGMLTDHITEQSEQLDVLMSRMLKDPFHRQALVQMLRGNREIREQIKFAWLAAVANLPSESVAAP